MYYTANIDPSILEGKTSDHMSKFLFHPLWLNKPSVSGSWLPPGVSSLQYWWFNFHTEIVYPPVSDGKTSDHMSTTQKPSFICSVHFWQFFAFEWRYVYQNTTYFSYKIWLSPIEEIIGGGKGVKGGVKGVRWRYLKKP